MRAALPPAFVVRRHGAWRAALVGLSALCVAATLAWWRAGDGGAASAAWALVGGALALLPLDEARRLQPQALRWDGVHWHVGPVSGAAGTTRPGRLAVVVDLGVWMLLRHSADRASVPVTRRLAGAGTAWIAVQRNGLEGSWHPFRCAVYSPPPSGPPQGAAVPPRA